MRSLRLLFCVALLVALIAACSSSNGAATKAPATHAAAGVTEAPANTPAGPQATAPGNPGSVATAPPDAGDPWERNAVPFEGQNGLELAFGCPPNGGLRTIWGTDTYTDDSSICTAGVHAGVITLATGGYVIIKIAPGQDTYTGSDRNGVMSSDFATWPGSYVVIKP